MSISGAVSELDKEIAARTKELARLTQIRDSLVQGAAVSATSVSVAGSVAPTKKKTGPKPKAVTEKKAAQVKAPAVTKKRTLSEATRKKMSESAKARAAAKKPTTAK